MIIMPSLLKVGSQRLLNDRAAQWNLIDESCGYCTFFKSTWHVVYHVVLSTCCVPLVAFICGCRFLFSAILLEVHDIIITSEKKVVLK